MFCLSSLLPLHFLSGIRPTCGRQSRAGAQIFPLGLLDITAWPFTESRHPPIVGQSPLPRNRAKYSFKARQDSMEEPPWAYAKCFGCGEEICRCCLRRERGRNLQMYMKANFWQTECVPWKKINSRTRKLFERINLRGKRTDSNMFGSSTNLRKINLFYVLLAGSGCRKVDDSCRDKNRLEHTFP